MTPSSPGGVSAPTQCPRAAFGSGVTPRFKSAKAPLDPNADMTQDRDDQDHQYTEYPQGRTRHTKPLRTRRPERRDQRDWGFPGALSPGVKLSTQTRPSTQSGGAALSQNGFSTFLGFATDTRTSLCERLNLTLTQTLRTQTHTQTHTHTYTCTQPCTLYLCSAMKCRAAITMWSAAWLRGKAPDFVMASSRSKAASFPRNLHDTTSLKHRSRYGLRNCLAWGKGFNSLAAVPCLLCFLVIEEES